MKIAMFGQKRIPSREGGVEIVVEELSTRMAMAGHDVTCYNRRGHHVSGSEYDTKEKKEYKNVRIKSVPTIEKKGLAAVSSSFFAALCSAFGGYDVVHIHAEGPAAFCFIPKIFRKKVIVTVHGLDWQREKWKAGFGSKYIHFGEKMAVKYADEIIVLSSEVKKYFKDTYGRKTRYIPNGVTRPDKIEADLIEKKFGLKKGSYILYLGRIVPEKGEHYLIEAFKSTLEEAKYADIIVHVVDASNPQMDAQMHVVYETLRQLGAEGKPVITLFNKQDKVENPVNHKDLQADYSIATSAKTGQGLEEFKHALLEIIRKEQIYIERLYDFSEAGKIQLIRSKGQLLSEEYVPEGIEVKAYVPQDIYGRL